MLFCKNLNEAPMIVEANCIAQLLIISDETTFTAGNYPRRLWYLKLIIIIIFFSKLKLVSPRRKDAGA